MNQETNQHQQTITIIFVLTLVIGLGVAKKMTEKTIPSPMKHQVEIMKQIQNQ